jgi:hypothetical protein
VEESEKTKGTNIKYFLVLQYILDLTKEIPRFPLKSYIYISIELLLVVSLVSKNPYKMSTMYLK